MLERRVANKILLLYVLSHIGECRQGKIRLQGIIFQIQTNFRNLGSTQTFNYHFIRQNFGPYSSELNEDIESLIKNKLMVADGHHLRLTAKGIRLVRGTKRIIEKLFFFHDEAFYECAARLNAMDLSALLLKMNEDYNIQKYKIGETIHKIYESNTM